MFASRRAGLHLPGQGDGIGRRAGSGCDARGVIETVKDSHTDADLIRAVLGGSSSAADALFARHWPDAWKAAYAVCGNRQDADDAAQDGMARAFSALSDFDTDRPFRPWLRTIVVRRCLNHRRATRHETPDSEAVAATPYEDSPDLTDRRDPLSRALVGLSNERRAVVVMRFWLDMEVPEIAEALGVPTGTASSRLARAMAQLRWALTTEVPDGYM